MSILRNQLRENIFIRIMLAFILGIVLHQQFSKYISIGLILCVLITLLILLVVFYYQLSYRHSITFKLYNGLLVFSICICFAFCLAYFQDSRNHQSYLNTINENEYLVEICNDGRKTNYYTIYEGIILTKEYTEAKVLLQIIDDTVRFSYGDRLRIRAKLKSIEEPIHPGQFNYKNFLANKHIYKKVIVRKNEVQLVSRRSTFSIYKWSIHCREKLLSILRSSITDTESYEMASALLLGERAELDDELMKTYSNTGTIHIISVSGLHVGIIFLVIQYCLRHIPYLKHIYIRSTLSIVIIWFYSVLTGLPPSVIRSATMISFHVVAKAINNKVSSINHVGASAVILLTFNTNYLFDIGFQLSYLAVLGILYLQKWLSEIYYPSNRLLRLIYVTTSVSIAVQLFTLPFCLYYFHQFPNYFIPANLVAIPFSSVALYAAIACLVFSNIPYMNTLIEWTLVYSIKALNKYLQWVSSWPMATTEFSRFNLFEIILICIIILFLLMYLKERQFVFFKYAIISSILLTIQNMRDAHQHHHLWIIKDRNNVFISIENKRNRVHFIKKGINERLLNKQLQMWKNYEKKHQNIVLITQPHFSIKIDTITLDSYNNVKESGFRRICMQ